MGLRDAILKTGFEPFGAVIICNIKSIFKKYIYIHHSSLKKKKKKKKKACGSWGRDQKSFVGFIEKW